LNESPGRGILIFKMNSISRKLIAGSIGLLLYLVPNTAIANHYHDNQETNLQTLVAENRPEQEETLVSRVGNPAIKQALSTYQDIKVKDYHGDLRFYLSAEEVGEFANRKRTIDYHITVKNTGNAPITHTLKFEAWTCGIVREQENGEISWAKECFGPPKRFEEKVTLAPNQSIILTPNHSLYHRYSGDNPYVAVPRAILKEVDGVRLTLEKDPGFGILIPHKVNLEYQ